MWIQPEPGLRKLQQLAHRGLKRRHVFLSRAGSLRPLIWMAGDHSESTKPRLSKGLAGYCRECRAAVSGVLRWRFWLHWAWCQLKPPIPFWSMGFTQGVARGALNSGLRRGDMPRQVQFRVQVLASMADRYWEARRVIIGGHSILPTMFQTPDWRTCCR
jgi:hypothetical protein